ncbi:MAG: hypothetical protein KatS3mg111_0322 [Pirellulaceae bacterium]|nr:MAG: hypothetical protein KatS3mg111_0322 [Pirellulaceae bacterium]
MAIYFQRGSANADLGAHDFQDALAAAFDAAGNPRRVLALPPDHTRADSRAGEITQLAYQMLGDRLTDVMPALGTHAPMTADELTYMFGSLPQELIRVHDWQNDVVTLGEVDADFVAEVTEGIYQRPWAAQVNRLLVEGGHDLILSIGQVVPHEVIGMANYNKNVFVGTGGNRGINESHYLSALYGMERIMGQCDTPLRRILNEAQDRFCKSMPLMYVLTVVESTPEGRRIVRGLFVGDTHDVFFAAGALSQEVNCFDIEPTPQTVVVTMNPKKYKRMWVANKAIYRTRMLIGDGGRLVVIAPGVAHFGESDTVDRLIRKYGYRPTPQVLQFVAENEDLQQNLGTAAHLIHGTSEGRFEIVYAPGGLSRPEIESVGYSFGDWRELMDLYQVEGLRDGWHEDREGNPFFFVSDPGLGLWRRQHHSV